MFPLRLGLIMKQSSWRIHLLIYYYYLFIITRQISINCSVHSAWEYFLASSKYWNAEMKSSSEYVLPPEGQTGHVCWGISKYVQIMNFIVFVRYFFRCILNMLSIISERRNIRQWQSVTVMVNVRRNASGLFIMHSI